MEKGPGRSIVLVGFMGTGKSAVARELSRRLDWPLEDVDERIVQRAGKPITAIFAEDGEPAFRQMESDELDALRQLPQEAVIATGGGIVLADRNWPRLRALGAVVGLAADPEVILQRVGNAQDRPLLAGTREEVMARIQDLLAKRAACYAKADWTCDTSRLAVSEVADAVLDWFHNK